MKLLSRLAALLLPTLLCTSMTAQTPTLSPVPQKVEWGEPLSNIPSAVRLTGADTADPDAVALLSEFLQTGGGAVSVTIGERGDKAVKKFAKFIPKHSEGYFLKLTPTEIVVAGNDAAGTFYGVQTLRQLLKADKPVSATVADWPSMPDRGVIEGFYGNPYSHKDRLRLFDFMGENKMNVFVYGPKDDPYHRSKWREPYPADEKVRMTELIARAHRNHVKFTWAIHPGGDIRWTLADSLNIVRKCEAMYDLGVRSFCVFFDDIGGEGARAEKQAALLNYMTDEFVKKHDGVEPLMMCPTQYNKSWSGGSYLNTLGTQMDASVRIMWTGATVIDMIERDDMEWINAQIGRKAYIWLNYPVTDYCIDHILMGRTYGNGKDIGSLVSGFCSNPMEYCEASKVSLYSLADYAWNPEKYDEDASWEQSMKYLMPEHAEAFRTFCDNNVDLGVTGHGLRRKGESPRFAKALKAENRAPLYGYFSRLIAAANELLLSTESPELTAEIRPWVTALKLTGERGLGVLGMERALKKKQPKAFINAYMAYAAAQQEQRNLRSRDFKGSIKVAAPVVATNYVEPWLREQSAKYIDEYKQNYDYRLGIFPQQLIPNGRYFIKVRGRYLSDPDYNQRNAPAVLRAERDTINPQSQEWNVSIDPETNRYRIVNLQGNRYLNELGRFGPNAYNSHWNTYDITLPEGSGKPVAGSKFAIRNRENAGERFWNIPNGASAIQHSDFSRPEPELFIFEFEPIDK